MRVVSFLIVVFSLLPAVSFTQSRSKKVDVKWGPEFKAKKRTTQLGIVHTDETGTYNLIREGGIMNFPYLQKFDNDLRFLKSQKQQYKQLDLYLNLRFMVAMNEQVYTFSGREDSETGKNYLFYSRIDKNTLLESEFHEKVTEMDFKPSLFFQRAGNYDHRLSDDESKLLIYYETPIYKDQQPRFGFKVYDAGMKMLWEHEQDVPYGFITNRMRIGNDGTVYIMGKVFPEQKEEGTPGYHMSVLVFKENQGEATEYPVKLGDKYITDMQMSITGEGNIICAGFYSEKGLCSVKGSFFLTVDAKTKKIIHQNHKEFSLDFMTQGMKERQTKKVKKKAEKGKNIELVEYELNEIIQREDGGAILVGEQYWVSVVTTTTTSNGGSTTRTDYYYNYHDIILVNIGPDGQIEWNQKIPKRQVTKNDYGTFSSYALKVVDDKLFFIFNDHPENLFYKEGQPAAFTANRRKSVPLLVEVDRAGNMEREALIGQDDTDLLIRPRTISITGPREMIIYAMKKRNHQLARVTFK